MQEQRVSYNTAVLAKEKGFDIVVSEWYDETGVLITETSDEHVECMYDNGDILCFRNGDIPNISTAPTQTLLQKWLREVHDIHIDITYSGDKDPDFDYNWEILYFKGTDKHKYNNAIRKTSNKMLGNNCYEEALEEGLYQALLLI